MNPEALKHKIFHLRAPPGRIAPLKVPRKLKKQWRKALIECLRETYHARPGEYRLHWQPGVGWTVTLKPKRT